MRESSAGPPSDSSDPLSLSLYDSELRGSIGVAGVVEILSIGIARRARRESSWQRARNVRERTLSLSLCFVAVEFIFHLPRAFVISLRLCLLPLPHVKEQLERNCTPAADRVSSFTEALNAIP